MNRLLSFNSIINTFLTAHNHRCQQSIRKRWSTLAPPNYFSCALICVCVCTHLNNLNQPDIIIFHLQLLKGTFLWVPRTHFASGTATSGKYGYLLGLSKAALRQGGKLPCLTVAPASLIHTRQARWKMHLVGINLFIKSRAGINQVWTRRTQLWHCLPCPSFHIFYKPVHALLSRDTLKHVIWPLSTADLSLSQYTIKHSSGIMSHFLISAQWCWDRSTSEYFTWKSAA